MRVLRTVAAALSCGFGAWLGTAEPAFAVDTICYTYDTLGRLELAEYDPSSGSESRLDYAYDANHNITNTTEATSGSPACSTPSGTGISAPAADPGPGFNIASNIPPVAVNDNAGTLNLSIGVKTIYVLTNDSDADSDPISIISISGVSLGTATTNGTSITYEATQSGTDVFSYTISDGRFGEDTGSVTITITGGCEWC